MKTLTDVLREADPMTTESRNAGMRAATRSVVLDGAVARLKPSRSAPSIVSRRSFALAAVFAVAVVATTVLGWQRFSVDAVAAMRFEARIEGTSDVILDTHDILTAQAVSLHDKAANGDTKSSIGIALTFTQEGAAKMRQATEANIGKHLELVIDDKVVMSPVIRSAISDKAMLTGDYTRAEAERIANGLLKGKLEK